jgi:hypothetical protein
MMTATTASPRNPQAALAQASLPDAAEFLATLETTLRDTLAYRYSKPELAREVTILAKLREHVLVMDLGDPARERQNKLLLKETARCIRKLAEITDNHLYDRFKTKAGRLAEIARMKTLEITLMDFSQGR